MGKPISEEMRDDIIGRNHIIFDEYLLTIFELPEMMSGRFSKTLNVVIPKLPINAEAYALMK